MAANTPNSPHWLSGSSLALTIALVYAVFGALWILLSDTLLDWLLQDRELLRNQDLLLAANTVKSWVFVVGSTLLIFGVAARLNRQANQPPHTSVWRGGAPWLALGTISLLIVATILTSIVYTWNQQHQQLQRLMQASAQGMGQRLADWHQERLTTARQIEKRPQMARLWLQYRQQPEPATLSALVQTLNIYLVFQDVKGVSLLDANGAVVYSTSKAEPLGLPSPDLLRLPQRLLEREAGWLGPVPGPGGTLRLDYFGWVAPDSDTPALLLIHVDAGSILLDVLDDWPALEATGRARLRPGPAPAPPWLQVPASDAGGAHATHKHVLAVTYPITGTDWLLELEVDTRPIWAQVLRQGGLFTLAGLLGIFSAFVVAYLLLQRRVLAEREVTLAGLHDSQAQLSASESRYRALAENAADVVWLMELPSQRFVFVSPSVERMLGYTPQALMELPREALLTPDSLRACQTLLATNIARCLAGDASAEQAVIELEHVHREGHTVWGEISAQLIVDASGQPIQIQGVTRDLTERHRTEHQIRMLSQATEQSPASVIITNARGLIEYVNPAFERMSGYDRREVLGRNPRLLQSGRTTRDTYRRMWDALAQGQPWHGELVNRRKNGEFYLQSVTIAPLRNERQDVVQYVSVQMDITAQRAAEDRLELLAWFDPLTGLPNRRRLVEDITQALAAATAGNDHLGLVILNVDRFKAINDALGRASGDQVLQAVGDRLRPLIHAGVMLAHLNSDEFGLLMPALGPDVNLANDRLLQRAEAIHRLLEAPLQMPTTTLAVTLSIGITLLGTTPNDSAGEALRRADTALHRAKEAGGHQTAFFDADMGQLASERFAIEQDLRRGIEAGELRLFLQPQVNNQRQLVGAEALVRWQHPDKGLISPALFVPVAETSGLIGPLGLWVLKEVCRLLAELQQAGRRLPIAVNISPRQFHQVDFGVNLLQLLEATGAPPGDLVLEITEGVVLREVDSVVQRMHELTRHGIRFSIDDFGTGYSSLSYLKRLPIHELKIDRSFVQDAPSSPNDATLVEAILSVAKHMQLNVVAEGVETEAQAEFLTQRAQLIQQGYLHGRPEPAEALIQRWLAGQ
jgi:diguanylate cyclase (GGDEF)-like protein/PAS domain S-box-containing protein